MGARDLDLYLYDMIYELIARGSHITGGGGLGRDGYCQLGPRSGRCRKLAISDSSELLTVWWHSLVLTVLCSALNNNTSMHQ